MEGMDYEVLMAEDFCQWESDVRFHDITHDDMKNGPGLRVVLWVAGCDHHVWFMRCLQKMNVLRHRVRRPPVPVAVRIRK